MQNLMTEKKNGLGMAEVSHRAKVSVALLIIFLMTVGQVLADTRTQAKRIHDRIAGVPPSEAVLTSMENLIATGNPDDAIDAAYIAMDNKNFYNATLVNLITPWTNEAQSVFPEDMGTEGTLNDYTATVIGAIRDQIDFRRILYDNILYVGNVAGLTPYAIDNNEHYKELEESPDLNLKDDLQQVVQSTVNTAVPLEATSGVLTSRAASKAFFVGGTNRAMFRFTMMNHLCKDMEQVSDVTLPADRIRQDVSRSPGGDSRIFLNSCIGCHSGMDTMSQAFAYYDYTYPLNGNDPVYEDGELSFNDDGEIDPATGSRVKEKNLINPDNFKPGFIVPDDSWANNWRKGKNSLLGWDTSLPGSGNGVSSMAKELAHSEQFARCQVEKVFKAVCLRPPLDGDDRAAVNTMITNFKTPFNAGGYELKRVFADTAVYCKGQ